LAAAFSCHAQSTNDAADQSAYGATIVNTAAAPATAKVTMAALVSSRTLRDNDPADHAAYGATATPGVFLRSRAEVRAEAITARNAGYEALVREGADPQYAVLPRAKALDTAHVLAGAPAPVAK
jgi:Tfp pilus assembly protein PilV